MYWCKRIKDLRVDADLTIAELAEKLDISARTISRYEKGISEPTVSVLIKLCLIYNVSIDYICGIKDTTEITEKGIKEKLTNATENLLKLINDL